MCREDAASVCVSNSNVCSSFVKLNNDIDMSLICRGKEFQVAGQVQQLVVAICRQLQNEDESELMTSFIACFLIPYCFVEIELLYQVSTYTHISALDLRCLDQPFL